MRESGDGKTVGITLRINKRLLMAYAKVASRANAIEIKNGKMGRLTAQDVMRHRLASLSTAKSLLRESLDEDEN